MSEVVHKKIPQELIDILKGSVEHHHRCLIVVVGSNGAMRIATISSLLAKTQSSTAPKVLWCYKKVLPFSTNQNKQGKNVKKFKDSGLYNEDSVSQTQLFLNSHRIRFCKYQETQKILGQTYGLLILQDFDDLTPNVLARTVETVSGGGAVIILLDSLRSLEDLQTVRMGFQSGMRAGSFGSVVNRFNTRFLHSLESCNNCIAINDEFGLLPGLHSSPSVSVFVDEGSSLKDLISQSSDIPSLGPVIDLSATVDQAKAILTIFDAVKVFPGKRVVGITAPRGRGKSAALGLSISSAIALGYTNVFVTAPSPSNLQALFEFLIKGLEKLGYKENSDYTVVTDQENHITTKVSITTKGHRQNVCYIRPQDNKLLGQCELLAIDEAAAIPLPQVRKLIGAYPVLFSSTVDGYEGTGRALSLKLFEEFRRELGTSFSEFALSSPIRYSHEDPIEKWLHNLLCLETKTSNPSKFPAAEACKLYNVNRDLLFSGNPESEAFLNSLVGLSVSSHYKNEPDDLVLMSDSPNHEVFVLLGPESNGIPEIICYVQIAYEGKVEKSEVDDVKNRGKRPDGDLIPWTLERHMNDQDFPTKTGVRIVRIAVHPQMQGKQYGTIAMKQLISFFASEGGSDEDDTQPLLIDLKSLHHPKVDYIGVSFGVTEQLLRFWRSNGFTPVYVSQSENSATGEHSTIVLRSMAEENDWLKAFVAEFRRRFTKLLGYEFNYFSPELVSTLLAEEAGNERALLSDYIRESDIERLKKFSEGKTKSESIEDLLPSLAELAFKSGSEFHVNRLLMTVLVIIGLQKATSDECSQRMGINRKNVDEYLQIISKECVKLWEGSGAEIRVKAGKPIE